MFFVVILALSVYAVKNEKTTDTGQILASTSRYGTAAFSSALFY